MTEFERDCKEIREVFPDVLEEYAKVMGLDARTLAEFTDIDCVSGEEEYWPCPSMRSNGGRDVTMVCNLNGKENGWDIIFDEGLNIPREDSQRLYVAAGLASIGLVHIAYDARDARKESSRDGLMRAKKIMQQLEDKEIIDHQIRELECSGKIESSLYPIEITYEDVRRINQIRFRLGVAYLVTNFDMEKREQASVLFTEHFAEDLKKLGENLISFAIGFGLDKHIDPEIYKQKGVSSALHIFNFAGIFPMDMSDIMRT